MNLQVHLMPEVVRRKHPVYSLSDISVVIKNVAVARASAVRSGAFVLCPEAVRGQSA